MAAGKHVLVEKPLADSREHAVEMTTAARERDLVLMCDHTYCYTPVVQRIGEMLADGVVGEVLFVDSVRINLGLVQPDVDVFWDLAPHDLSILDYVLPGGLRPEAVAAHGADPLGAGKACVGYLTMPLPGGAMAHVHVNWLSPTKIRQMVIGGTRRHDRLGRPQPAAAAVGLRPRRGPAHAERGRHRPHLGDHLLPPRRHARSLPAGARGARSDGRGVRRRHRAAKGRPHRRRRRAARAVRAAGRLRQPGRGSGLVPVPGADLGVGAQA